MIVLLAAAVAWMLLRPRGLPVWLGPVVLALAGSAVRWIDGSVWADTADLLDEPLLFIVFAVPLALLLDEVGVFGALAELVTGRHLVLGLWVLAALVTALLNLDAAVVLLTPLYVRIARRHGIDPVALAFQPALLACLASSALPVSNLTNLIARERFDLDVAGFLAHLLLPATLASTVGWFAYRATFDLTAAHPAPRGAVDRAALRRAAPVLAFVVVGFTAGQTLGVPAWVIAALATVWAAALARRVVWHAVPLEAIAVAFSLTLLVLGAVREVPLERVLGHRGLGGQLAVAGYGAAASVATNNLPAVVGALDVIHPSQVWSLLIAANIAPALIVTGSLSGLLWRETAHRLGVHVGFGEFSRVGRRIAGPALVVAVAVTVLLA